MNQNFHLIRAIANEYWFLNLGYNLDYLNAVIQGVVGSNVTAEVDSEDYAPKISGRVAIIPIIGVLTKYDGACGALGMQSYADLISRAINDTSIDAIVLGVDSPGGQVAGTNELSSVIASSQKPVVGFVSDMACSGAYRLLSACRAIVANNNIASVGSLGVMVNYADYTAANEACGVKVHQFYAPQSKDKNQQSRDIAKGDYSSIEKELEVVADEFLLAIKSSRPSVQDDQLTGKVYFAKDVVGSLVDSIGSLDSAVSLALSLCKPKNNNMSNPKKTTQFKSVVTALGVSALESLDGFVSLSEDQIELLGNAIDDSAAMASTNQSVIDDLNTQLSAANDQLATATAERDAALVRITAMEAAPAVNPSVSSPAADGGTPLSVSQYSAEQEAKKYL